MPVPPTGPATDLMTGTLFFNFGNSGWSEKYNLAAAGGLNAPVPDYVTAATQLNAIAEARKFLLGAGCKIVWGRVSLNSQRGDSVAAFANAKVSQLVGAETVDTTPINEVNDGLLIRIEDGQGRHAQRVLRGVRDTWITAMALDTATWANIFGLITPPVFTAVPVLPLTLTEAQAIQNYVYQLWTNTVMVKKNAVAPLYTYYPCNNILFRRVAARDTGRPFGTSRGRAATRV